MSIKVAVTAAGGGVGQSIIKALKGTEYKTVALDPDSRAAGLYFADKGVIGPRLTDYDYAARLVDICLKYDCKYIFPGFDAELRALSRNAYEFINAGVVPIISSRKVIDYSDDKLKLYTLLKEKNFPFIETTFPGLPVSSYRQTSFFNTDKACIVKPLEGGCRSQDVYKVSSYAEAESVVSKKAENNRFIIQEYIEGPEYTCGTVSFDGDIKGIICMVRELRDGDTYKAKVDQNPLVIDFVAKLIKTINPYGPCNVQLRVKDEIPYVLEINARCSGTTAARAKVGFNEPKMVLDYLEGKEITKPDIVDEASIYRYWEEQVVLSGKEIS